MASTKEFPGALLVDAVTGALVGAKGSNGIEYLFPATPNATPSTTPPSVIYNSSVGITGGTINGTSIGATTRAGGFFSSLNLTATDSTGTPGNVTNNSPSGRASFAAAASSVVVTNSNVSANSIIQITLLGAADATLDRVVGVTVAAGSFTVIGNAAATAAKGFMFTIINT
jgi:hypothetical protein